MNPLNDDELDALIGHAKSNLPPASPGFAERVMRGYREQAKQSPAWNWLLWRPVPVPAGFGILAALVLVAAGAVAGRTLLAPPVIAQTRRVEVPVVQERVVYRECAHATEPQSGGFTFNELQPVREIHPRVVRSIRDDQ
jgi:hypothetical protein